MLSDVRIDVGTLSRSESGNITGRLVLAFGAKLFPTEDWNDFPLIVLGWWAQSFGSIASPGSGFHLRFMDGPFVVRGLRSETNEVTLELMGNKRALWTTVVDRDALANPIKAAARDAVAACIERGWDDPNLHKLQALD